MYKILKNYTSFKHNKNILKPNDSLDKKKEKN